MIKNYIDRHSTGILDFTSIMSEEYHRVIICGLPTMRKLLKRKCNNVSEDDKHKMIGDRFTKGHDVVCPSIYVICLPFGKSKSSSFSCIHMYATVH